MAIPLQEFKPFNSLPEPVLKELYAKLVPQTFPKNTFVFTQGQPSLNYLFLIKSGLAEIIIQADKGSTIVGLRHPGEFFGETVVLTGKRYPASVKAVKDLNCYLLDRETFEGLLQNHREFAGFFSRILTDRLRDLYEEMVFEQSNDSKGLISEPFKKRVCDIMSSPVFTCPPETPINQIARIFFEHKISSIVITGGNGKLLGLVSERDLISKVLALDSNPTLVNAGDIMEKTVATLPPDALFYQALLTMIKGHGKYILVMEQGRPIGIITIGDLTRARTTSLLSVVRAIDSSANVDELSETAQAINRVLATMVSEKAPANEINELISELNDNLTRKLLTLGEEELAKGSLGNPPCDYCWLALGSGGRKEQTLSSDQDNALIFADPPFGKETAVKKYFNALAHFVVEGLEKCGVGKCPGETMATNPAWCQAVSDWKHRVQQWIYSPDADNSRQLSLFLDFRPIFGQEHLSQELREFTLRHFRLAPAILHHMAKDDLSQRVPLNVFKQVILEKKKEHRDEVDLKKAGCIHIINCIRIFAMREGIQATSTLERLVKLVKIEALNKEDAEYYEAAFQSLMMFRLRENLRKVSLGLPPDNYINPANLSKRERSVLRESFIAIDRLQTFTGAAFSVEGQL